MTARGFLRLGIAHRLEGHEGSAPREAMEKAFRICTPSVVSEVIDGEAVIMDLRSGNYFSATGAGALIWQDLEASRSYRQILQSLTANYEIDSQTLTDAADRFLAGLIANNLIEEIAVEDSTNETPRRGGPDVAPAARLFDKPVLTMHTDLQDLLLLDPIHDVGSAGWPIRKT